MHDHWGVDRLLHCVDAGRTAGGYDPRLVLAEFVAFAGEVLEIPGGVVTDDLAISIELSSRDDAPMQLVGAAPPPTDGRVLQLSRDFSVEDADGFFLDRSFFSIALFFRRQDGAAAVDHPGVCAPSGHQVGHVDGYEHHRWVDSLAAFESATRGTFAALVDAEASSAGVSWQPIPDAEPED